MYIIMEFWGAPPVCNPGQCQELPQAFHLCSSPIYVMTQDCLALKLCCKPCVCVTNITTFVAV